MTVTLNWQTIVSIAAVIAAAGGIGAFVAKLVRWIDRQKEQDNEIEALKTQQGEDKQSIDDELCLITYGLLSCLKGLREQGCNGPVTEAITKIEKHMNQRAHHQE